MTAPVRPTAPPRPATRAEVFAAVAGAFGSGAIHRDGLVATARRSGARDEVITALLRLPACRYRDPGQMFEQLARLPHG